MKCHSEDKLLTLPALPRWREALRNSGKKLVVTNGIFDLMHRGHAEYLQQAAESGDALLVLVNDDASVTALKGPSRPIQPEADRCRLLAALECVDAVCAFTGPKAADALRIAAPDVYVKGGDYTLQTLDRDEYAALQAVGAQIRILKLVPGCSTTGIVQRILAQRTQFGDTGKAVELNPQLACIFGRRSIRKYQPRPVDHHDLAAILEAAMAAPSAKGCDPEDFIVVSDPQRKDQLAKILPNGAFMTGAPVVVVVCGSPARAAHEKLSYAIQDCSACIENMLIAAHQLGMGGCWLGIHPMEERIAAVKGFLELPDGTVPVGAVVLGWPAEKKPARTRYDAGKVHLEKW